MTEIEKYLHLFTPVTLESLPPRDETTNYSNPPFVVIEKGQIKVLCFNHEHMCWDDESGDDFHCAIHSVSHWLDLSKLTTKLIAK